MIQAPTSPWSLPISLQDSDDLDWTIDRGPDEEQPFPLVRRRPPPRARTFAGVGGPSPRARAHDEVDELRW